MRLPFSWKYIPLFFAGVLLLLGYGGRNLLFGGLITELVATQIEAAAGPGMDVRIEHLRGSWFTGIALEGISTANPAESGLLRAVSAQRIEFRYNVFGFLGSKPLNAFSFITARKLRVHIAQSADPDPAGEESPAETVLPGQLLSTFLDTLPARLEIDADVEVLLESASNEPVSFQAALSGNLEDDLRLTAGLPGGTSILPLDRDEQISLAIRAANRSLRLRTLGEETSMPIELTGRIEVSDEDPATITALEVSFDAGPLSGSLSATPEGAEAFLTVSPDRATDMPVLFLSQVPLGYGTLKAGAKAAFGPEAPRSVIDLLLVRPQEVLPFMDAWMSADFASWSVADMVVSQGEARIFWDGNRLTLSRLDLDAGSTGTMEIEDLVLDPAAAFPIASLTRVDVRLQDLGKVIGAFTQAEAEIAAPVDRVVISASSDGRGILTVSSLDIRGSADGAEPGSAFFLASGVLDLTEPSIRRSEFSFRIPDLGILKLPAGQEAEPAALSGSVFGEGSFSGSLAPDELYAILGGSAGRLAFEGKDLLVSGLSLPSFQLAASLSKGTILVEKAEGVLPNGHFTTRARLNAQQGLLRGTIEQARLVIAREEEEYLIALRSPATFSLSDKAVTVEPVSVSFLGGELSLEGTLSEEQVSGSVSLDGVQIAKLLQLAEVDYPAAGSISADITAQGPLAFPQLAVTIRGSGFSIKDIPGDVHLELHQDDRSLLLDKLEVDFGSLLKLTGSGRLPFGIGGAGVRYLHLQDSFFAIEGTTKSLQAWLPEESDPFLPDGEIIFNASVVEDSGEISGSLLLRNPYDPVLLGVKNALGYQTLSLDFRIAEDEGDQLRAGLSVKADSQQIAGISGSLTVPGLDRLKPQFDPDRIAISGGVSLNLPLEYLITFLPQVIHLSGMITGNIKAEGTLAQPLTMGRIEISGAELRTEADIPTISELNGVILLDGRKVTVDELRGELGYALFMVTAQVQLPSNGDEGSVDMHLSGSNILMITNPDLRARANADIGVQGTFEKMRISGTVELTDALYTKNIPLFSMNAAPSVDSESFQLFSVQGETGKNTELDIQVRSDRTIRIRNNLYSGNLSTDLHIGGTLEVPIPTGRIFGDEGELKLPLTTIQLQQILVRFPQDDPFSPIVLIRGVARIRGYELTLNVSGSLPDVEVQITSTPALPQEQALVLLTTRYTPQELAEAGSQTVKTLGGYIGIQLFSSLLEAEEGETILDRVDIVIGNGISDTGRETVEIEFRLGAGDSWYMVFERDRHDRYNLDLAWRYWFK